jgi:hypothetical protein
MPDNELTQNCLDQLRAEPQVGLDQLKRGTGIPAERVSRRLRRKDQSRPLGLKQRATDDGQTTRRRNEK